MQQTIPQDHSTSNNYYAPKQIESKHVKNSIKLDKPIQKFKQLHMHIFSNNFQHAKLARNSPKSLNKNTMRTHQILQVFLTRFFQQKLEENK